MMIREEHGLWRSPEYNAWSGAKGRCSNKNNPAYKSYGGRGITMDERWCNSFMEFYKDMGKKPTPKHSLDRVNNDEGYNKSNCRWATSREQNLNTRVSSDTGEYNIYKMRKGYQVKGYIKGVSYCFGTYKTIEEAIEVRDDVLS